MRRERNVIIGAGIAGARAAEAMRAVGYPGDILMVGAEKQLPYHRPPLSKEFLDPEPMAPKELLVHPESFFRENQIELELGLRVVHLDSTAREVTLEDGRRLAFDNALVASGVEPRKLSIPGSDLEGVIHLRTLASATALGHRLRASSAVVVIGAGLIGLEVASQARAWNRPVVVLEAGPSPMTRVLPEALGAHLAAIHRDHGVDLRTGVTVTRLGGGRSVEEVLLASGERIAAETVVIGIGVEPDLDWLAGSGLALDRGIVTNEYTETSRPGIFAAGDIACAWNPALGRRLRLDQAANAAAQGAAAGRAMAGRREVYVPLPSLSSVQHKNRLHIVGLADGRAEVMLRGSATDRSFIAFFVGQDRLTAAVLFNRARDLTTVRKLVASRARVEASDLRDEAAPLPAPM